MTSHGPSSSNNCQDLNFEHIHICTVAYTYMYCNIYIYVLYLTPYALASRKRGNWLFGSIGIRSSHGSSHRSSYSIPILTIPPLPLISPLPEVNCQVPTVGERIRKHSAAICHGACCVPSPPFLASLYLLSSPPASRPQRLRGVAPAAGEV